ncbi:hypothetical protein [Thiolapillus sp.]|uniref:hypothetical protein n=1 Tax=Thiolapillus sp. TaxID=2017437 RepID=UPI003AF87194
MIDFGTSQSPKSTRPLTTYSCPSRPGHQALRNNFASSLLLRTWLPMTGRRVRRPTLFSLWRKARRENSAASRLLGSTSLRFALHGWQRTPRPIAASPVTCRPWQIRDTIRWSPFKWPFRDSSMLIGVSSYICGSRIGNTGGSTLLCDWHLSAFRKTAFKAVQWVVSMCWNDC